MLQRYEHFKLAMGLLLTMVVSPQTADAQGAAAVKKGSSYPAFSISYDGKTLQSDSLRGKMIWMNFWFEACKPCVAEMPAIQEIVQKYEADPDFIFLSMTWENKVVVERMKTKHPMSYPVVSLNEEEAERLNGGRGYPTNIIIDKAGKVIFIVVGGKIDPALAREELMKVIEPIIAEGLRK
jgi:thiol-disulfide isomerase/thioredoxin